MNYIYIIIYLCLYTSYISHYQPISAIDMTLWLSHSQPPGPLGHEAKGWRSANRLVELRDATKLLGSVAVDAMVGVPWCTLRWQKHGQLAINMVFLGEII
jgi:hypothetical protein